MRLGITRSADQLKEISSIAAARGVEVVALPLTKTVYLDFELPHGFSIGEDDWIIFTSANGVHAFFEAISRKPVRVPHACRIAVVGKKTRNAVEDHGYDVSFISSEPYGEKLFQEFVMQHRPEAGKVIYARAADVHSDPSELFKQEAIDYYPVVCYRTQVSAIDENTANQLSENDAILFTAPTAVRAYAEQFGQPVARALAIGNTTASQMTALGWARVSTMPEPDIEKALELV